MKRIIVCGMHDCIYNGKGKCAKDAIGISNEGKCINYERYEYAKEQSVNGVQSHSAEEANSCSFVFVL